MADEYATERAAEAAGARIQAYTLYEASETDGGRLPLSDVIGSGYWRTLEEKCQWTRHPSRYRAHPEDVA